MNPIMGTAILAGNASRTSCACGEDIVAVNDEDGRRVAVRWHQQTPEHLAWLASAAGSGFDNPHHRMLR